LAQRAFGGFLLADAGLGAVGDGDLVLGGLLGVAGLLGDDGDTTVLSGLDTDGLDETYGGELRSCRMPELGVSGR
jgi:hypothetical protein